MKGPEAMERVIAATTGDLNHGLRYGSLVSGGWYPVAWYRELHEALARALGSNDELAKELGVRVCVEDFTGIYKVVASMLSPETIFGQARRLMSFYFQGGTVENLKLSKGEAVLLWQGWEGFNATLWADVLGGSLGVLVVAGAENPTFNIVMGGRADSAKVEFRWGPRHKAG